MRLCSESQTEPGPYCITNNNGGGSSFLTGQGNTTKLDSRFKPSETSGVQETEKLGPAAVISQQGQHGRLKQQTTTTESKRISSQYLFKMTDACSESPVKGKNIGLRVEDLGLYLSSTSGTISKPVNLQN